MSLQPFCRCKHSHLDHGTPFAPMEADDFDSTACNRCDCESFTMRATPTSRGGAE